MGSRVFYKAVGLICLLALGAAAVEAQPASLVADLNTVQEDFIDPLFTGQDFAALGTTLFFIHDDGIHGIELWKSDGTEAGTVMVKDVCPGACRAQPFGLTVSGSVLYFAAQDGVHGQELWRTDGTAAGTFLVVDLNPRLGGMVSGLFSLGGALYLVADDGVLGSELWKTDGTAAGTVLVADLLPGPEGSSPRLLLDLGDGRLLFSADDGVHGREPWVTDGTSAGTVLLKDVKPGATGSMPPFSIVAFENDVQRLAGGGFLFVADDGVHGQEPWFSDGTAAGTILLKDLNPGSNGSQPYGYKALPLNGSILFAADDGTASWELWSTDGTEAGTHLVKDIHPGGSSSPRELTPLGGRLYFAAFTNGTGRELWATDGTEAGTVLIKDIEPGTGDGISPFTRTVIRPGGAGLLLFANDGVSGNELWTTDGTMAGTRLVKDVAPGSLSGVPYGYSGITVAGSTAYFHGFTTAHGFELWKSDGTEAGTAEVKNATTLKSSLPVFQGNLASTFGRIRNRFLFDANDGVSGLEPWVTDGTAASTQQLADLNPGPNWGGQTEVFPNAGLLYGFNAGDLWRTDGTPAGTSPVLPLETLRVESPLVPYGPSWYFTASDSTAGSELWKTDGTAAGTQRVRDITPGTNGSYPGSYTVFGSLLLFAADENFNGYELWRSDGTEAGTFLLKDLSSGPLGGNPGEITPMGSVALFIAHDESTQPNLWKTDGTTAGTVLLKPSATGLTRLGDSVIFLSSDTTFGREIWKTDGTAAGTVLVKDIRPGPGSSLSFPYFNGGGTETLAGNKFFFMANDGVTGVELWKTEGTTASTVLVKDIFPGPRSAQIQWMTPHRGRLFFVADDGVHGRELWVSDGTEAGTRMVKDIVPGPGSPVIQHLKAMGRVVLFNATDGVNGVELWRSDGTEAGTAMLQDIAAGAASSSPVGFFSAFPNVYFAANDNVAGFELWSFPRSVLGSTFPDVPPTHWAWPWVETLADAGLTGGCGNGLYCPSAPVTRAETAAFLVRGIHGIGFVPPAATGTVFDDVPASYWAAPWIEQLAADGLTSGCSTSPSLFCPESDTNRDQMAVLLLKAIHGPGYTPPAATGTVFDDVPAGYWAAAWIEQLAAEGITTGCDLNLYCPTNPVTRDQMAVFLARAFHLPLP